MLSIDLMVKYDMRMQELEHEVLEQTRMKEEDTKGKERRKWKELIDELESDEAQEEYAEIPWTPGD